MGSTVVKLRQEWALLRMLWKQIALAIFVLFYVGLIVMRNLAYYNYYSTKDQRLKMRLRDVGFGALPEVDGEAEWIDVPMYCIALFFFSTFISTYIGEIERKPHFVNMVRRFLTIYTIAVIVRGICFLSTVIPGAAGYCLEQHPGDGSYIPGKPTTWVQVLGGRVGADANHNCGDLVFSGHTMTCILMVLHVLRYGEVVFGVSWRHNIALVSALALITLVQVSFIIAARHHYTVDVMVAIMMVPLLWFFFENKILPTDAVLSSAGSMSMSMINAGVIGGEKRQPSPSSYTPPVDSAEDEEQQIPLARGDNNSV